VLFAHSRAVSYAIAYASEHPDRVAALVCGDAPAVHRSYPQEWIEGFAATEWREQRVEERLPRHVLEKVQREARHVDLWDTLAQLPVPTTAFLGGARRPEVVRDLSALYRAAGAEVVVIAGAGHALSEPDFDRFVDLMRDAAGRG
jgi:pimeloyl-ACP methyl ester carboxylesterase